MQYGEVWLIIVQRVSINATFIIVVNNYGGSALYSREVIRDTGFTYATNTFGTVAIYYDGSTNGVFGGAYKLH